MKNVKFSFTNDSLKIGKLNEKIEVVKSFMKKVSEEDLIIIIG